MTTPCLTRITSRASSTPPLRDSQVNQTARMRIKGVTLPENHLPASLQSAYFATRKQEQHVVEELEHLTHKDGQSAQRLQKRLIELHRQSEIEEKYIEETQSRILAAIVATANSKAASGSFGVVTRASIRLQSSSHGTVDVAIKVMKMEGNIAAEIQNIQAEIAMHHKLTRALPNSYCHPNITPLFYDTTWIVEQTHKVQFALVMPWAVKGTLRNIIDQDLRVGMKQASDQEYERQILRLLGDMESGLDFMHLSGIINADLKPENVLAFLHSNGEILLKLTDFGLSTYTATPFSIRGTPNYVAPELFHSTYNKHHWQKGTPADRDSCFGPLQDVFALGIIFFELIIGNPADYVIPVAINRSLTKADYDKCTVAMNTRMELLSKMANHEKRASNRSKLVQLGWTCLWQLVDPRPHHRSNYLLREAIKRNSFADAQSALPKTMPPSVQRGMSQALLHAQTVC